MNPSPVMLGKMSSLLLLLSVSAADGSPLNVQPAPGNCSVCMMNFTKLTICTESKTCDTVPVCNGTNCRNETNCNVSSTSCYDRDWWTNMTPNCSSCECTRVYNCSTPQNYQYIRDCFMGHCTHKSELKNSSETCSPPVTNCSSPTPPPHTPSPTPVPGNCSLCLKNFTKHTYCIEVKLCDAVLVCNGTNCRNETNCSVTPSCSDRESWTNMTPNCSSCECTAVYNCSTAQNYLYLYDCSSGQCIFKYELTNSSETCSPPVTNCSSPTPPPHTPSPTPVPSNCSLCLMKSTKQTYCTESKMCDTVPVCNGTSCRNETNCSVTPSCYDHDRWTNMTPNCSSCECTGVYNCSTAQNYQFIRDCFMGHCTYKSVLKNSSETCSPPVTSCSLPTPTLSPSDELVRTNGGAMSSDSLRTGMLVLGGVCGGAALVVLIVFRLWYGLQIKKDRRLVPDPWENSMVKVEKVTKDVIEMKE